jgi:DNA-binding beta-propeller fold protein YncE
MRRGIPLLAIAIAAVIAAVAYAGPATTGELTQKPGTDGCVAVGGGGGACGPGTGLGGTRVLAVSPDGRNVYAGGFESSAVAVFDRDQATGKLAQESGTSGCISEDGTGGACADGHGLTGASTVAVSPGGTNVYAAADGSSAVTVFDRDPATGSLTQLDGADGCISAAGGSDCDAGTGLDGARFVLVSPHGENVYVASQDANAIAVFDRDPTTGILTQKSAGAACISESGSGCTDGNGLERPVFLAISPDGKTLYAASEVSQSVAILDRDPATGQLSQDLGPAGCVSSLPAEGCTPGVGLDRATSVAVSPDGLNVYVASYFADALTSFDRNAMSGDLTQKPGAAGCISEDGSGTCEDGSGLDGVHGVTVSPDGENVYATAKFSNVLSIFDRGAGGALTRKPAPAGCVSETGADGCADGTGMGGAHLPQVSPDGANLYMTAYDAKAIAIFDRFVPPPEPPVVPPQPPVPPTRYCDGRPATLVGTPGPDLMRGTPKADAIVAGAGADVVRSLAGNDRVCGGRGDDHIFGMAGADRLQGAAGRDRLAGGEGADLLRGGAGGDRCAGGPGRDRDRSCEG